LCFIDAIERAGVGMDKFLGRNQDVFQQPVDVVLARERHANGIKTVDRGKDVDFRRHGGAPARDVTILGPSAN